MPGSIYIHLEKSEPGFDSWDGSGGAVAENLLELGEIAADLGIPVADDFLAVAFRGDPEDPSCGLDEEGNPLPENWFAPEEGLAWVRTMRSFLQKNPGRVEDAAGVIEDLEFYESVLLRAEGRGNAVAVLGGLLKNSSQLTVHIRAPTRDALNVSCEL